MCVRVLPTSDPRGGCCPQRLPRSSENTRRSLPKVERTMSALLYEIESDETTSLEFLVEAAQAGDRDAFGELATRFEPMVYAIALRRLGNHSEAQELCQEVLVKAMQKIEQLKVPAAFAGWLRSITVRMSLDRPVR